MDASRVFRKGFAMNAVAAAVSATSPAANSASAHAATDKPVWSLEQVQALFDLPFMDLVFRAQQVHRENFDPNAIQRSTLLSVKTGGCSEDCGYCSQSARYSTDVEREALLPLDDVLKAAQAAKDRGASRFCMGAAWRGPKDKDLDKVTEMISAVKALGLQTCVTLGMLKDGQAEKLKDAGLDYYNHNLDTDKEFYGQVIKSHCQEDRIDTLEQVRDAGINVCSGGIIGMGETRKNRAALIAQLANLRLPINGLVPVSGTPLGDKVLSEGKAIDSIEFVRTIAVARITMPTARVRLSAGRRGLGEGVQALCFLAGANSIFYGDKLLTTGNPEADDDRALISRLGLKVKHVMG